MHPCVKNLTANTFSSSQRFFTKLSVPYLPLLEQLLSKALINKQAFSLKNTAIVYIHHPLQTSVNLVDSMVRLGAVPKNIFILGKKYSECKEVVDTIKKYGVYYQPCSEQAGLGQFSYSFTRDINWLWKNVTDSLKEGVENVLVLDHGGYASSFIPPSIFHQYKVVGVEKTAAGLTKLKEQGLPPFPVINMANCATKKILESPLIVDAIINKLLPLIPQNTDVTCGIIGYGAIGKSLAAKLLSMKYKIAVYDRNPVPVTLRGVIYPDKLEQLIEFADYIFGCTGQDSIKSIDPFRLSNKDKALMSCSSEDKEFLPLLKAIQKKYNTRVTNPLDEVQYITDSGATIRLLKGGFPVNFDSSGESVPRKDIQLTRALALTSILQATQFFNKSSLVNKAGVYALDPHMQYSVANKWLETQARNFPNDIIDNFQDVEWILDNSEGSYEPCSILGDSGKEHKFRTNFP
ncbi:MAG: NAD(P)-dependent oxidoreductase [Pseudomonadota bacterium]